jgi:hypothetical protein
LRFDLKLYDVGLTTPRQTNPTVLQHQSTTSRHMGSVLLNFFQVRPEPTQVKHLSGSGLTRNH